LDGTVNTRDLGGLPLEGGGTTRSGVLLRSDNLQGLTGADVHRLIDEFGVRTVADLRTEIEVESEGPGPLTREPVVEIHELSLFPEAGKNTDVGASDDGPAILPWQNRSEDIRRGASGVYLRYLDDRSDSVVGALRAVAYSPGSTIVHCAAGKDRTGVVVAMALAAVGTTTDAIVADYTASAERIDAIMARLRGSVTYADDLARMDAKEQDTGVDKHTPRADSMREFLDGLTATGGATAWLKAHGWTDADQAALTAKLVG
jgi:protein tyrosine/serine phosphatase